MTTSTTQQKVEPFLGKWKLVASENFEEYLATTGTPAFIGKLTKGISPKVEVSIEDGKLIFRTIIMVKTLMMVAHLDGESHEVQMPEGSKANSVLSWKGDHLVVTYSQDLGSGEVAENVMERWIDEEGQLVQLMTFTKGGRSATAKRIFARSSKQ